MHLYLEKLVKPSPFLPEKYHQRARLLSYLLLTMILLLLFVFPILTRLPGFFSSTAFLTYAIVACLLFLAYGLSRTRHYGLAAIFTVALIAISAWAFALTSLNDTLWETLAYVVVSVVLCSLLLSIRFTVLLSLINLAGIILLPSFLAGSTGSAQWEAVLIFVFLTSGLTIIGAALRQSKLELLEKQSRALESSQSQLQSILDNSMTLVSLKDTHGRYLMVNRQYEAVLQVDRKNLIGRSIDDVFPPEIAEALRYDEQKVLQSGETLMKEESFPQADGDHTYISTKFPLCNADGTPYAVCSLSTDITDRKRAEKALLKSEEQFRLVSYATNDAIWDWDLQTEQRKWNQSIQRLFGYKPNEVETEVGWWERHIHPDDREKVINSIHAALDGGEEFWSKEYRFCRPDDSYAYVFDRGYIIRENGQATRFLGAMMDISERKRVEDALLQEQYLLHTLMDNVPDWIYFKDLGSHFINVNRAYFERYHYENLEEVIGKTDFDIFTDEHARPAFEDEQQIIKTGKPVLYKEEMETPLSGPESWIITNKMPMRDASGQIIGTFGISRDITEQKRTEKELQEANQKQSEWIRELEQRSRESTLLNEMSDLLQTCPTAEEAYAVIGELTSKLFPQEAGGLYIINASRNLVELAASWGGSFPDPPAFEPSDCWGLRLGRLHTIQREPNVNKNTKNQPALFCQHIQPPVPAAYMCVPLVAQGEPLGLLHIRAPMGTDSGHPPAAAEKWFTESKQQLARTVGYALALALANLRLRETLRQQSIRDPLTGLFNRRYMEETLEREIRRVIRAKHPLGVIMIDVDHFKQFNDKNGHEAGDAVLRELGRFLRSQVRAEDIPCRYGGEEFILILPDAPLEAVVERAKNLREGVKQLNVQYHNRALGQISISAGVSTYPQHGSSGEAVIRAADSALYNAKRSGRDQVAVAETIKSPKPQKAKVPRADS